MQIITVAPVKPVNPYAKDVAELVKAATENPDAAGEFIVPNDEAGKARFKIGTAANDLDRTATLVINEPGKEKGTTRLVFKIKARMRTTTRTRKGGTVANADAVTPTGE